MVRDLCLLICVHISNLQRAIAHREGNEWLFRRTVYPPATNCFLQLVLAFTSASRLS